MSPSQKQERGEKEQCNGEEKRETRKGPLGTREALLGATVSGMAGWRRRPLSWAVDSET